MAPWIELYGLFIQMLSVIGSLLFDLITLHFWVFFPFIVSFVCLTISVVLRLIMVVRNNAS